ncbi:MAG: DUF3570 domain-containing protein [bacterium]|nr:DUF3570 domain-containing protein [bacterium]
MRMQLKISLLGIVLSLGSVLHAQDTTEFEVREPIDIYFVSSYYKQDGNNSPVTGGRGTEQLSNIAPSVFVHIPVDSARSYDINAGVDYYSSASSDNIDNPYLSSNHISGASSSDTRQYYSFTFNKKTKKKASNSYTVGASSEYDVTSLNAGYSFSAEGKNNFNHLVSIKYFFDDWKLIYPVELRNGENQLLNKDKRHTLGLTYSLGFVVNRRLKGSITTEPQGQFGLLSTPFHRFYVQGELNPRIESMPSTRLKIPVGLRLNAYLGDKTVIRTFNRLYQDSWGVTAYTGELEIPIKFSDAFTLSPIYRFHVQSASQYFHEFNSVDVFTVSNFYTSDFDLSAFYAHKYGLGMSLHPIFGLARVQQKNGGIFMWKRLDLRFVYYHRNINFNAWNVTLGTEFTIDRKKKLKVD